MLLLAQLLEFIRLILDIFALSLYTFKSELNKVIDRQVEAPASHLIDAISCWQVIIFLTHTDLVCF